MITNIGPTRRGVIRGLAFAGAAAVSHAGNTAQQLPVDYAWDHSIKDFASLKQSTLKFAARKGNNIPVLSLFGDIDQLLNIQIRFGQVVIIGHESAQKTPKVEFRVRVFPID